jgi:thymidine kinase
MPKIEMTNHNNLSYLEIILGGMYAGKTSRLIEIYKQCKFCDISVSVINHSIDNRYDTGSVLLSTHDNIKIPCIKTNKLFDLWYDSDNAISDSVKKEIYYSNTILINEGQFFPDLYEFVKMLLLHNKKIYVCGLDGDYECKKFGKILDLIPLCDKVTKLTSLCSLCKNGTPGIFSKRIGNETEQTIVGSCNYIPVCRVCYNI